ncbi:MAG: helix-turn-helix domain-containing protein [Flavobacteriales bacterium]|nr:helix-turn-helix domain-containing protein [Flavobacteriales bacterium]
MGTYEKLGYVKRTQKDYSLSFKLQIVQEVESGELGIKAAARKYGIQSHSTVTNWLRKYGNFDWENQSPQSMSKTPEQKLMELEQKVRLLEKKNATLEKQSEFATNKAIIFDMMIDLAEKEYKIKIRKNSEPK